LQSSIINNSHQYIYKLIQLNNVSTDIIKLSKAKNKADYYST